MLRFGILAITPIIFSLLIPAISAYEGKPVSDGKAMTSQFLIAHNRVRASYNVEPLKWDRKLARYARHWAYQRINDCQLEHSPNSPYGENLFWCLQSHWTPHDVVMSWAQESKFYNFATNQCINNVVCGHFTQLIWSTSKRLGCGRVACNNNQGFLFVCSYDPPGNYYHEGPFGGSYNNSIVNPPSTSTFPAKNSSSVSA